MLDTRWAAPTDEDEAHSNDVGEHVAADGLTVPPVSLPKEAYERVELVPAETLQERHTGDGSTMVALAPSRARAELASCLTPMAACSSPWGCSWPQSTETYPSASLLLPALGAGGCSTHPLT